MKSQNQLEREGFIKRKDGPTALLSDIHFEPGFNLGNRHEDDDEDDAALYQHIVSGGVIPPLEVRPRDEGGLYAVDCHRRVTQLRKAAELGVDVVPHLFDKAGDVRVAVVLVDGGYIARNKRLLTSAERKDLTPLQRAEGILRLAEGGEGEPGLTPDQIAAEIHKTRQHVDQMLILARAPDDIKQAVAEGRISATEAFTMVRRHKGDATSVLKDAEKKAGGKVTGAALKPWTPPAAAVVPLIGALDKLHGGLSPDVRMVLLNRPDKARMIPVPAHLIYELVNQHGGIAELREKAEAKAREKAEKAKQLDLADADGA